MLSHTKWWILIRLLNIDAIGDTEVSLYLMRQKIKIVIVLWLGCLVTLSQSLKAAPPRQAPSNLSTPELIALARARGVLDDDTANLYVAYALGKPDLLPIEYHGTLPWDGTLPLLRLRRALHTMAISPTRARIEQILAGHCGSSFTSLPNVTTSTHFHVEYRTIGGGLTITNYLTSLETTWSKQVDTFGWAAPPVSSNPPPSNTYHVRIDALGSTLYGYVDSFGTHAGFVGDNPNTTWNDQSAYASCMVLNQDYVGFPSPPQSSLDATIAHEFNHSIQFGYGALTSAFTPDDVFVEGGATWMEDEAADSSNDNYNFLYPQFQVSMGAYTFSPYRYWIVFRALTERYGTGGANGGEQIMQDFWEATSKRTSDNLGALQIGLSNQGANLADAYHHAAIALKFMKTCGGQYVYPYCLKEAAGYVATKGLPATHGSVATIGGSYNGSLQDNYALNWIALPTNGAYRVSLQNTATGGQLRGSVVCDTGATLNVIALPAVVNASETITSTTIDASVCESAVAVITNQMQTANHPNFSASRTYTLNTLSTSYTRVYLPLVTKPAPPPDLVGSFSLSPNQNNFTAGEPVTITVVVTNQGGTTTGPFWVDFYINPSSAPTMANQIWSERCGLNPCFGLAWFVPNGLAAGQSITLSSQAGQFPTAYSRWLGWLASGTSDVYLYVDSWNPPMPTGAVLESDESNNRSEQHGIVVTGANPPLRLPNFDTPSIRP
jgi:hypothetical protein